MYVISILLVVALFNDTMCRFTFISGGLQLLAKNEAPAGRQHYVNCETGHDGSYPEGGGRRQLLMVHDQLVHSHGVQQPPLPVGIPILMPHYLFRILPSRSPGKTKKQHDASIAFKSKKTPT